MLSRRAMTGLPSTSTVNRLAVGLEDAAAQHRLTVGGGRNQADLGELALGALVIARRPQRAVEPGRAHFEVVALGDDVGDVERGRQIARNFGEKPEVESGAAFGHDRPTRAPVTTPAARRAPRR